MTQPSKQAPLSYADYLAQEESSEVKHEYLRGRVWAMAGGSIEHGRLAARMIAVLAGLVDDQPCEVFSSDVRIRARETDFATYPDVSVVCGRVEVADDDAHGITNPVLIIEVLSDSTEAHDRGVKWAHYQRIPSLQEYVLVSQHEPRIEVFRRVEARWHYTVALAGEELVLESVRGTFIVDEVFRSALESR